MSSQNPERYPTLHLALVSAQAAPNITHLLDPEFRPKLVSYQKMGKHIKRRADDLEIRYVDGGDIHRLQEKVKEWVK